jgi:serine/threonine-protein kinase HipA
VVWWLVCNILLSNADDRLRDHGFPFEGPKSWHLSPAYDLDAVPTDISQFHDVDPC